MLLKAGEYAIRSVGIHLSAIFGNELYNKPASKPATNAPVKKNILYYQWVNYRFRYGTETDF